MRLMLALRPDGHMFHQVTGLSDLSSRQPGAEGCSYILAALMRVPLHLWGHGAVACFSSFALASSLP